MRDRRWVSWFLVLAACSENDAENVGTDDSHAFMACGFAVAQWDYSMIPQQSGRFTMSFYATPNDEQHRPIDAVIGLANGRADAFSDLAAIVRFNDQGFIDVRNGSAYAADVAYPYRSVNHYVEDPILYHFTMDIDIPARRYSVSVRNGPESPVPIATNYAFRTEQASITRLDTVNAFLDSPHGHAFYCEGYTSPSICRSSPPGAWANTAFPAQTGEFYVEVDAMAHTNNMDAVVGLSRAGATRFTDLAAIVRFNQNGFFDARDGSTYRSAFTMPYVYGQEYTITFIVNMANKTYTAVVTDPPNARSATVAENFRFRTEQAGVTALGNLGQFVDYDFGAVTTCDLVQGNFPL